MESQGLSEYKESLEQRNFNNVVELLVAVGKCKRKLELVDSNEVNEKKHKCGEILFEESVKLW